MSQPMPSDSRLKMYSFGSLQGGVNLNDPAISLPDNQAQNSLNVRFLKKGFDRWVGAVNLTDKAAVDDMFRGLFSHGIIAGTQYLYGVWGGKVYSINKTSGAIGTAIYDLTGTGEAWGSSYYGKFYLSNGTKSCKIEGATAYQIGITAPAAGASGKAAGGTLADGVYKIKIGFARKISGLNVLYSQSFDLTTQTLGGGDNTISITGFTNSTDPQVNNKVIWMTDADGDNYYYYGETGDNTSTTLTITSNAAKNNAILYDTFSLPSGILPAVSFLFAFGDRLWGVTGNRIYYSLSTRNSPYNIERFPANNYLEMPFQVTGLFSMRNEVGTHLYVNTAENGIMIIPEGDISAKYEHWEQKESFQFMRSVADWNNGKIGLTKDKLGFFDGFKFQTFDYGYNIRPVLDKIWTDDAADFHPCGAVYRRENRIEYLLSMRDTSLCATNNNRTFVLNLSQTFFQDSNNFVTPWEILGRGFNYVAVDSGNTIFFAQSFTASSTLYKELSTATTEQGIYDATGTYLDTATAMRALCTSKTYIENMFTAIKLGEKRLLAQVTGSIDVAIVIADDLTKNMSQSLSIAELGGMIWDVSTWDNASWSNESPLQYAMKGKMGVFGKSWFVSMEQTSDDINMNIIQLDILATLETGRRK